MASSTSKLTMRLLIDTKTETVIFAEASKPVVDFLLYMLCLPIGSVAKLVGNNGMVGSIGNVYQSVQGLDELCMQSEESKDFILKNASIYSDKFCYLLPTKDEDDISWFSSSGLSDFVLVEKLNIEDDEDDKEEDDEDCYYVEEGDDRQDGDEEQGCGYKDGDEYDNEEQANNNEDGDCEEEGCGYEDGDEYDNEEQANNNEDGDCEEEGYGYEDGENGDEYDNEEQANNNEDGDSEEEGYGYEDGENGDEYDNEEQANNNEEEGYGNEHGENGEDYDYEEHAYYNEDGDDGDYYDYYKEEKVVRGVAWDYQCPNNCSNNVTTIKTPFCNQCNTPMEDITDYCELNTKDIAEAIGFVKDNVTFLVMDDLVIQPITSIIEIVNKFNVKETREMIVELGMNEGIKLLKASLESKMVLTRVFLNKD